MADEVTLIDLRVKQNEQDIAKIKKAFSDFSASIKDANRQLVDNKTVSQASAKATDDMAKATARAAKEQEELAKRAENVERLVDRFQRAADAGDNTAAAAEQTARALGRLGATDTEIQKVADSLGLSAKQANELNSALTAIGRNEGFGNVSQRVALAGDVESGVRTIGGAAQVAGLGEAGQALAASGELFAVIEAAPRLKAAFQGMPEVIKAAYQEIGASGIGLIGALAALAAATSLAKKEFNDAAESQQAILTAQKSAFELIRTGSAEQIQLRRDEINEQLRLQREYLTKLERDYSRAIRGTEDVLGSTVVGIIEFSSTNLGIGAGSIGAYNDSIKEQSDLIKGLETEFNALNSSIDEGALSAQQAAEAEKELARQRTGFAVQYAKERAQLEVDLQQAILDADSEGVRSRIASYEEELKVLDTVIQSLELTKAFTTDDENKQIIQDEIDASQRRIESLEAFIPLSETAADAIDRNTTGFASLAGSMTDLSDAVPNTMTGISDITERFRQAGQVAQALASLEEDLSSIREQSAAKIADIERQLAQRREDLAIDLERKLADAVIDATNKRFDAQLQYNRDALKIERDLSREKIAIQRKFANDSALAVADRDVLGFTRAKQARNEALQEAKEGAEEQRQTVSENYKAQLDTINRALDQQQQSIRRNYDRQLEDANRQAQRQIQLENQRATQALNLRQQAYNAELQQLNQFAVSGVTQLNGFTNAGLQAINTFVTGAAQQLNSLNSALSGAGGGGSRPPSNSELQDTVAGILSDFF